MEHKSYPRLGEELYTETLENGLRLQVLPKPGFRSRYAVLAVNYGGVNRSFTLNGTRTDTPAGVAHYLEHKRFDLPEGDDGMERLSANGADPNAFTAPGITCYYFRCTENFEENLRLLLHFVSTPYFTEETVQKERGIIAQEIREDQDSPDSAVYDTLLRQLYAAHPLRDPVIGDLDSIREISARTLYACHRAFYVPGNMCLCVEGDVDVQEIGRIARECLPAASAPLPETDYGPAEGPEPVEKLHRERMDVSAPLFLIGAKLCPGTLGREALRERLTASLALRLLVGASSPFFNRLYAQGLLNRSFDASLDFSAGQGTLLLGGESRDPEAVLRALEEELERVRREGLDPAAFRRAKRASLGSRLRGLEDFESICIALAEGCFDGYCALDATELLEQIRPEDCRNYLLNKLMPEYLALSILDPRRS